MVAFTLLDFLIVCLGVFLLYRAINRDKGKLSLPPGPKGLPIVGNVLDMPTSYEWRTFIQWSKEWGDIVSITLLGQTIIILGSPTQAFELLEKRSSTYSDRPKLMMGGELVGWSHTLALSPYGERFREYRRFFHRFIGSRAHVERFHPLVERETHNFLRRLLRNPEDVAVHIRTTAGAIILMLSYGYQVQEGLDPFIQHVNVAIDQFAASTAPGAFFVDVLPILQYVPGWFPGAGFQKKATEWKKSLEEMVEVPFKLVKDGMSAGTLISNFTSELLESEKLNNEKIHNIKWSAASLYSGGADTTVSAIYGFFLAMTLFPETQRKAQAEIDAVVGNDRLPALHDRENLPYVEALYKEVLRFNPVAPLGLPHGVTEDDVYEGYHIPKGSMVIANIWKFLHDPETYRDPMIFEPSRFLASQDRKAERDPCGLCFGFGRRLCPGMMLADTSVWMSCAMTLATFDISHVVENGEQIPVENTYLSGTISHPKPFRCSVKPRSSRAEALVLAPQEA